MPSMIASRTPVVNTNANYSYLIPIARPGPSSLRQARPACAISLATRLADAGGTRREPPVVTGTSPLQRAAASCAALTALASSHTAAA